MKKKCYQQTGSIPGAPCPAGMPAGEIPATEEGARDYLIGAGILRIPARCLACGGSDIRLVRRNQLRCRDCRNEQSLRRGSILDGLRISFTRFLTLVRLFAENVSANEAARRLGISYNTVYEVYHRLRAAIIVSESPRDPAVTDPPGGPGTGGVHHQVIFGIRFADGRVEIAPVTVPDPRIIAALPVPAMQRGNILFIDAFGKTCHGFITYDAGRNGKEVIRISARDGMSWSPLSGFWEFAGRTWSLHKGIDREHFPAFVRELAFRYNNRGRDLYPLMIGNIARAYGS